MNEDEVAYRLTPKGRARLLAGKLGLNTEIGRDWLTNEMEACVVAEVDYILGLVEEIRDRQPTGTKQRLTAREITDLIEERLVAMGAVKTRVA